MDFFLRLINISRPLAIIYEVRQGSLERLKRFFIYLVAYAVGHHGKLGLKFLRIHSPKPTQQRNKYYVSHFINSVIASTRSTARAVFDFNSIDRSVPSL